MSDFELNVAGETLRLCPEAALFWPKEAMLFVADLHWGKTATFRAHAIPICDGPLHADLARLTSVLRRTGAKRLIVLGDLLHHRRGRQPSLNEAVAAWRSEHADVEMTLVRGNHDRGSGDPPSAWNIACIEEGRLLGPFELRHVYQPTAGRFVLAGHEHPKVRISGSGDELKLACFWQMPGGMILPAFSQFIDSAVIRPQEGDQVFVLTGDSVAQVPAVLRRPTWAAPGATRARAR